MERVTQRERERESEGTGKATVSALRASFVSITEPVATATANGTVRNGVATPMRVGGGGGGGGGGGRGLRATRRAGAL